MVDIFGTELLGLGGSNTQANTLLTDIKSQAQLENAITFAELFNRFSNLAITRYEWEGLPESIDERFLNTTLYLFGQAAIFEDSELGYMALPCEPTGRFNVYYNPISVRAYSFNYNKTLTDNEFTFVRNNPSRTPTAFPIMCYTRRMADILRTIDVTTRKMKHPYIFLCDEKDRLTYQNMIKKVQDNEIMILGSKTFGIDKAADTQILNTETPNNLRDLWESYHSMENILYTALGINSTRYEKRERLIRDEVNSNNMVTEMTIEVNVKELQKACEDVNKKFNLNIWVEVKQIADYQEVNDNGTVYSGVELVNKE